MLKELSVEEFVREVASSSPAPGGGSVAALAGAQGAGLLSMYCNLSQDRNKLGDQVDLLQKAGEEARFLKTKLLEAIDEDTIAFNRVMEAYRLPKESGADKEKRKAAIQAAAYHAADIPLHTTRGCLRVLSIISEIAGTGNPTAITDLGVANLQAFSGLTGAYYNVIINLDLLSDQGQVNELASESKALLAEGQKLFAENSRVIEKAFIG